MTAADDVLAVVAVVLLVAGVVGAVNFRRIADLIDRFASYTATYYYPRVPFPRRFVTILVLVEVFGASVVCLSILLGRLGVGA